MNSLDRAPSAIVKIARILDVDDQLGSAVGLICRTAPKGLSPSETNTSKTFPEFDNAPRR
jgi:hypothetical protein